MAIDFFENDCQKITNDARFGLCDDINLPGDPPTPAYTKAYQEADWIAIVENNKNIDIQFIAIDHCVISDVSCNPRPSACDCMLTFLESLLFIELKNRRYKGWWEDGLEQLSSTIHLCKDHHDISKFVTKKAYLSNCARPVFIVSNITTKNRFEDNTGFDLHTETLITV